MTNKVIIDSSTGKVVRAVVRFGVQCLGCTIVALIALYFGFDYFDSHWFWKVLIILSGIGIGSYLYYFIFGAGVTNVQFLTDGSESGRIRFSFEATIFRVWDRRILVAELPEDLGYTEGQVQQFMFKQNTKAQLREIADFMVNYREPVSKEYTFRGKRFLVEFYPEHNLEESVDTV